jgi:hypothetical protein
VIEVVEQHIQADLSQPCLHMLGKGGVEVLLDVTHQQGHAAPAPAAEALRHAVGLEA